MSNIPAHLLTPRDWQAEAVAHAARECGTPEGRRALAEATRYGALADRLADLQAALDAEHAQRIALQHHAADQAQRVADLEAEIERITEAGRAHIRRAAAFEAQRDALAARLAKIEAQPPVAWVRYRGDGGIQGPLLDEQVEPVRRQFWTPLIAADWASRDASPAPAQRVSAADELAPAAAPDEVPMRCAECGQLGWHKLGCSHVAHERGARLMVRLAPAQAQPTACRDDGRCQYAIDHGAEGLGHCPPWKCAMPCEGGAA